MTEAAPAPTFGVTTCPRHPGAPAVGTCERCGTFVCAQDLAKLGTKTFCSTCAARTDVDYLEAFRLKHWGKRDGWAWAIGIGALFNLAGSVGLAVSAVTDLQNKTGEAVSLVLLSGVTAFSGINGVLFWLGIPLARWGLVAVVVGLTTVEMLAAGPAGAVVAVIPSIVAVNIFVNWRTRLFFKLPVQRPTLQRAWDLLHNNSLARQSLIASVAGLVIPGFALIGLIMGLIGLKRVDPNAWPPIGKKGYAIAGIVLGALGTLGWLGVALAIGFAGK